MTWKPLASAVLGLGLVTATGWGTAAPTPDDKKGKKKKDDHAHGAGPHGGVIFDLGKHIAEFTVDHKKKEATVYLLGIDEKTPAPVKADKLVLSIKNTDPKFQVELLPVDKDKDGKASKFVGKHDGLGKERKFEGSVSGEIDGKPYTGEFKEEPEKKKK